MATPNHVNGVVRTPHINDIMRTPNQRNLTTVEWLTEPPAVIRKGRFLALAMHHLPATEMEQLTPLLAAKIVVPRFVETLHISATLMDFNGTPIVDGLRGEIRICDCPNLSVEDVGAGVYLDYRRFLVYYNFNIIPPHLIGNFYIELEACEELPDGDFNRFGIAYTQPFCIVGGPVF